MISSSIKRMTAFNAMRWLNVEHLATVPLSVVSPSFIFKRRKHLDNFSKSNYKYSYGDLDAVLTGTEILLIGTEAHIAEHYLKNVCHKIVT